MNRIHVMERAMQINDPNSGSGLCSAFWVLRFAPFLYPIFKSKLDSEVDLIADSFATL